jgi:hypothetical protein
VIINEAPAGNKAIYSCINECLKLITNCNEPFGNKIIILVGDFRQCGPVIRSGTKAQIIDTSLRKSLLWNLFQIERLSIPIRNVQDPQFADFVGGIGDRAGPVVDIPYVNTTIIKAELIEKVWPTAILSQ